LRSMTGAFALAGIARLIALVTSGFDPLYVVTFGVAWLLSMSVLTLGDE
jgi:hypothetical protein